jgi:hypothetical protein
MDADVQSEFFPYRGYQVTIARWNTPAIFAVRAEIRRGSELECVLTNSGPAENYKKLLRHMGAAVMRWIDRQARWR